MNIEQIIIYDTTEQPLPLASLWQEQALLLFVLRHPGCAVCREKLLELKGLAPHFSAAGVQLAALTMAFPIQAAQLAQRYLLPFPLYSDPRRQAYQALGFMEGSLGSIIGLPVLARQLQAALRGQLSGPPQGQALTQLGGMVLFAAGASQPHFVHIAEPIYDYPAWDVVLAQATQAATASSSPH